MAIAERRGFIRVIVDFFVTVETRGEKPAKRLTANAMNISLDGILLKSQDGLPEKPFLVKLPAEWGGLKVKVATVRREGAIYGCKFLDTSPQAQAVLDQIIYHHWRRSLRNGPVNI